MSEKIDDWKERYFAPVVVGVIIAGVIGLFELVRRNETNNQLTLQQVKYMSEKIDTLRTTISGLQIKLEAATFDRWSRSDHLEFEKKVSKKFDMIDTRLRILEQKRGYK